MLRRLLSLLAAAPLLLAAQTFYYVNNIGVSPAAPTTADPVTITLFGDLSASNSYIIGTAHNVVGGQVQITVNAGSQGIGIPVLVPHDESFNLGTLAAGTYTITIGGTSTGDLAPALEHQFTVSGGGGGPPCDSLVISPLTWHPFTDTALVLQASNSSSELFDYPGFVLLDAGGDTLAEETVNYFGIGQGPQPHTLSVHPGANLPTAAFWGQLDLWKLFYTEQMCTWTDTVELCPPSCAPIELSFGNFGGGLVNATFDYLLTDDAGAPIDSGTFSLGGTAQWDTIALCLPPGNYELNVVQPNVVGGQLVMGVSSGGLGGPQQNFIQGGAVNLLPFPFYPACLNGPSSIPDGPPPVGLTVLQANGTLVITSTTGDAIGPIELRDVQGRLLRTAFTVANTLAFDTADIAPGLLIVVRTARDGRRAAVRVMNMR